MHASADPSGFIVEIDTGPSGPAHPATHFIAGALNEVSHHGTQIGVLRDLYAWRQADHADTAT